MVIDMDTNEAMLKIRIAERSAFDVCSLHLNTDGAILALEFTDTLIFFDIIKQQVISRLPPAYSLDFRTTSFPDHFKLMFSDDFRHMCVRFTEYSIAITSFRFGENGEISYELSSLISTQGSFRRETVQFRTIDRIQHIQFVTYTSFLRLFRFDDRKKQWTPVN